MPTSRWELVPEVVALVSQVPHERILDVGPGYGKYAVALRELLNDKPHRIDAVEAEKSYVEEHGLACLYDSIEIGDVCDIPADELDGYDIVLMVDVLEHIDDAKAFALLGRIPGRVVIGTPVAWFQTDDGLPESETHRSHWTEGSWAMVRNEIRPVEACYQSLGAWLVRLAPLNGEVLVA